MAVKIEFRASLPPIQSAVSLSGDGGARVKLDVPDSDLIPVMKLATLKGRTFKVTVELEDE